MHRFFSAFFFIIYSSTVSAGDYTKPFSERSYYLTAGSQSSDVSEFRMNYFSIGSEVYKKGGESSKPWEITAIGDIIETDTEDSGLSSILKVNLGAITTLYSSETESYNALFDFSSVHSNSEQYSLPQSTDARDAGLGLGARLAQRVQVNGRKRVDTRSYFHSYYQYTVLSNNSREEGHELNFLYDMKMNYLESLNIGASINTLSFVETGEQENIFNLELQTISRQSPLIRYEISGGLSGFSNSDAKGHMSSALHWNLRRTKATLLMGRVLRQRYDTLRPEYGNSILLDMEMALSPSVIVGGAYGYFKILDVPKKDERLSRTFTISLAYLLEVNMNDDTENKHKLSFDYKNEASHLSDSKNSTTNISVSLSKSF